jgi:hypothetical protein
VSIARTLLATLAATLLITPAADAMSVQIVNDSGLDPSDVYVQFWVPPGQASTASGITANTSVPLSSLTGNTFSFTAVSGGRIVISYDGAVPAGGPFPAAPPATTPRWDMVELTVTGSPYDTADLTAVEWFGIPLQVAALNATGGQLGATLGWNTDFDTISTALQGIDALALQTPTGTTAGYVSPAIANAVGLNYANGYPDLTPYVSSLQGRTLTITDTFAGQTLNFTGTVGSDDSITLNGTYGGAAHSMVIPGATINAAIYSGSTTFTADTNTAALYDDNQWYSQVFVDVINGFSLGQWGGNWGNSVDAVAGQTGGWYQQPPYAGAWNPPTPPAGVTTTYNPWGAIVAQYGNAFQSPFSQSPTLPTSMQPQLTIGGAATLQITIPPDHVPSTVSASAAALDFTAAPARPLIFTNTGRMLTTVGRVRLTGGDRARFGVTADGCSGHRLMPGGRCRMTVRYRKPAKGAVAARLVLPHDARGGRRSVTLEARARKP